jgi:transposase-like protein
MKRLRCPDEKCLTRTNSSPAIIIRFGFYQTRRGKRRRFRCKGCSRTFCRNSGTVYHRLPHRRATFDEVAALSVEGVNKSAIARVQQIAWNTVDRWLEKAAAACRLFNSTIDGSPRSGSANCRPMRSARWSAAKSNRPFGSLLPLKFGLASGLRPLLESGVTGTHSPCFETFVPGPMEATSR